ncbi:hypothetical protein HS125_01450 [bacterium]|nr:hypothetical protein [bacterium]
MQAQTTKVFDQDALLRYIEHREELAGAFACTPRAPYLDLLFLSTKWQTAFSSSGLVGCACDPDFDGLSSCFEIALTTDPLDPDTDNDCMGDGLEILLGTNPLAADTVGDGTRDNLRDMNQNGIPDGNDDYDKDGLGNCEEVLVHHTNPLEADTDFDLLKDGDEITKGTDPRVADTDQDGFIDGEEVEFNSDPLDKNSLPVDPNATYGLSTGLAFSVVNQADPSDPPYGLAVVTVLSVENRADPTGPGYGEAFGPTFALENRVDPTGDGYGLAFSLPVAVENRADPTEDVFGGTFRRPFSVQNTGGGKAALRTSTDETEASQ